MSLEKKPKRGDVGPTWSGALWSAMASATHENKNACAGKHARSEDSPRTPNGTRDGTRNRVYGCASNSGAWVGIESEHTGFREVRIWCPMKFAQCMKGPHARFTHATSRPCEKQRCADRVNQHHGTRKHAEKVQSSGARNPQARRESAVLRRWRSRAEISLSHPCHACREHCNTREAHPSEP